MTASSGDQEDMRSAMVGLLLRNYEMNVHAQVGLVMLIGLAAQNAILIVEFARMKRDEGTPTLEAALEAARLRLRSNPPTSFCYILANTRPVRDGL